MKGYQCKCKNVEIGSYDNQVKLHAPFWSSKEYICVDRCLSEEIQKLWMLGIQTNGCCCGHNKANPYIGVYPEYVEQMEKLGYAHCGIDDRHNDTDNLNFIPKSIKEI